MKNNNVSYETIWKIATGQRDDYTAGCLLDYIYFKGYYKMIAVDLSKQQALDADPKAIQQINFTAYLDRAGNARIYFILEEAKETALDFSERTVKVCRMQFHWVQLCWIQLNAISLSDLIFVSIKWHNTTV